MGKILVTMGGVPGSGKSTRVQQMTDALLAKKAVVTVVRPDDHLIENDKYVWTPDRSKKAWAMAYAQLSAWLKISEPSWLLSVCIFDATLVDPKARAAVLNFAKPYKVKTKGMFMNTPMPICHARNDLRSPDRRVPYSTMVSMGGRVVLPTKAEGYDSVDIITPSDAEEIVELEDM